MNQLPAEAVLRDGTSLVLRSLGPGDRDQLRALFARMSPRSLQQRFCCAKREVTESELAYLSQPDGVRHVAIAAVAHDQLLGVGRYFVLPGAAAEIAFDVGDADQGRGIGTLLLEHLVRLARERGVATFRAQVQDDNRQMLEVFERCGFELRETVEQGVYEIAFSIADTPRFLAASAERERQAVARSVGVFFAPSSVAVVGASRTPRTIGRAILDNLVGHGFPGPIYPINPRATELAGLRCYPSVAAVGAPIDLAIIAVPAPAVEAVVRECACACVRGVVVISAGFAEVGHAQAERELRAIVREAGMRMVGPNCMGVLSTDPRVRLDATFSPSSPPRGGLSLASQSGALGLTLLDFARELQLGIADFVSLGNKADVSVNDLLAYWHDAPETRVIALYLESFGNPRAFARIAPEVARRRPIVAVKSGRSAAGTRAARSHSAALASLDVGIDALFAQTGVIRTDTLEQLFDVASLLSNQPVPRGRHVGVVTNAGGPGILFADACEARGLALPVLDRPTLVELRRVLPALAGFSNPVDLTATAGPAQFETAIRLVGGDPSVDTVVAIYVPPLVTQTEQIAAAIARGAAAIPAHKPIATVFMSSKGTPPLLAQGPRGAIPSYSFPENAAMALAAAARYGRWRDRPAGARLELDHERRQAIRARVAACAGGWQPLDEIVRWLALAGIRSAAHRTVEPRPEAAAAAANQLGYPVVLKAQAPGLLHKSERGGVVLDLHDAAAVRRAAERVLGRISATALIVQRQVPAGVEAIVGMTQDATLGPLLLAGLGGTSVELYRDVAFRITPVSDLDAAEMLDELRGRALLEGFRDAPPADRAALIDVIRRIGALVDLVPELAELDLNPVIVREPGEGAIVADARMLLALPGRPGAARRT
ncbi:MAG: bifunctional acetate--CoA ligase family protein/GNAT family N-acetyltransferase [Kofleriaceae bacterium]